MHIKKEMFRLDNSYLSLPSILFSNEKPEQAPMPKCVLWNQEFFEELNIHVDDKEELERILVGNRKHPGSVPFSQAYAGHQFGNFTMLGDGRAIHIGEHLTKDNNRFDIQLKGAGPTKYSRRGDGRATLKSMLREYLMSEAITYLGISSSRSLAVIKTGKDVYRETTHEGAVLTRVMKSHIRVGTFEFIRHFGSIAELKLLTDYTISRLYPSAKDADNPIESFFLQFAQKQIDLVCDWMRVGFIHGVMNTDNTSISAETFDYGPCAFMNTYHPSTVFSSIDSNGRYAYGKQAEIIQWNMTRLLEALLPLLNENEEKALQRANELLEIIDLSWRKGFSFCLLKKIGLQEISQGNLKLAEELLDLMQTHQLDYTNTFATLSHNIKFEGATLNHPELNAWFEKWDKQAPNRELMQQNNPVFIPRNHLVEDALNEAVHGDLYLFSKLLKVLKNPYKYVEEHHNFSKPPETDFENNYQTYCGT